MGRWGKKKKREKKIFKMLTKFRGLKGLLNYLVSIKQTRQEVGTHARINYIGSGSLQHICVEWVSYVILIWQLYLRCLFM